MFRLELIIHDRTTFYNFFITVNIYSIGGVSEGEHRTVAEGGPTGFEHPIAKMRSPRRWGNFACSSAWCATRWPGVCMHVCECISCSGCNCEWSVARKPSDRSVHLSLVFRAWKWREKKKPVFVASWTFLIAFRSKCFSSKNSSEMDGRADVVEMIRRELRVRKVCRCDINCAM